MPSVCCSGSEQQLGRHLSARPPLTHRIKGTTPLMVAAVGGNVNCLGRLLAAGAPPNEATSRMYLPTQERGVTALMCACSCKAEGGLDCAEMLLRGGAKIDTQDVAGLTALAHAVLAENPDVVELMMKSVPSPPVPTRPTLPPALTAFPCTNGLSCAHVPRGGAGTVPTLPSSTAAAARPRTMPWS